ncbi:hypothetical protein INT43_003722 [Umbelopsis isabellina]|uniref:NDT80 domain-containing protein n=1 Tax=Mortierella isabellina TaxID=91625 RepID=A0A8H7PU48_MORIS|nr:hypothetical protein INT43_003722 [Umbelopsis isabellina]
MEDDKWSLNEQPQNATNHSEMSDGYYAPYPSYPSASHSNEVHGESKPDIGYAGQFNSTSQPSTPRPEDASPLYSESMSQPNSPITPDSRRPSGSSRSSSMSSIFSGRRSRRADHGMSVKGGPLFTPTKQLIELWTMDRSAGLQVQINSRIDRGFFLAENDWTCYRRNYFQISGAFDIYQDNGYPALLDDVACCIRTESGYIPVRQFLFGIGARVAESDKPIDLVQHTAKRDKGPQVVPAPKPIRPGGHLGTGAGTALPGQATPSALVTFERLQFKTATANNGKRRAAQQYYEISVDVFVQGQDNQLYKIATCHTAPLVVRGRSPGHYSDHLARQSYMDHNNDHYAPSPVARHHPMSPVSPDAYNGGYSPYSSPYPYHYGPLVSPPVRSDGMPLMMHRYPHSSLDIANPDETHSPAFHSPGDVGMHSPTPDMHQNEAIYRPHTSQHNSASQPLGLNIHPNTDNWNHDRADSSSSYYGSPYPTTPSSAGPHLPTPQYPASAFEPRSGGASLSKYQMKTDIPPHQISPYHQAPVEWQHRDTEYHHPSAPGSSRPNHTDTHDTPSNEDGKETMQMSYRMGKMEAADNL